MSQGRTDQQLSAKHGNFCPFFLKQLVLCTVLKIKNLIYNINLSTTSGSSPGSHLSIHTTDIPSQIGAIDPFNRQLLAYQVFYAAQLRP
jgi:hypothetical protein